MANPTLLKLGSWNTQTDQFLPHASNPNGAILDLNDNVTWTLVDSGQGLGDGLDLGLVPADVLEASNPRTTGSRVVRRTYVKNRKITAHLMLVTGQTSGYSSFVGALRTLTQTLESITDLLPAALLIQPTNASTPVYADVLAATHNVRYDESLWSQLLSDGIQIEFLCRPFLRGARQTLANLVTNPGFEAPGGPATTVFADHFDAGLNHYSPLQYAAAVGADTPIRYYTLNDLAGSTTHDSGSQARNGTYGGTYTLNQQPGALGGADSAVLFDGSTASVSLPTTGLPTGNASITLEAWANVPNTAGGDLVSLGTPGTTNEGVTLFINASGDAVFNCGGTLSPASSALSTNVWHHLVAVYDGAKAHVYVDGAEVGSGTAYSALNLVYGGATIGAVAGGGGFYLNGTLQHVAIYSAALSAARILAHYNAGLPVRLTTTAPANTYVDVVAANVGSSLIRYYRLDEASGTVANDISGALAQGTYVGSPTLGATGLITGSGDAAVSLNGSSQYITEPNTGIPTGSGAWTQCCLCKPANATNGTNGTLMILGNPANAFPGQAGFITQHSTGGWDIGTWGGVGYDFTGNGASVAGHIYLVAGTFDGVHLDLYVGDITAGASSLTHYGPFSPTLVARSSTYNAVGYDNHGNLFNGVIDEAFVCNAALSSAALGNIYTAAKNGASGTVAETMTIPAGAELAFGSPAWSAINTWGLRFRYAPGLQIDAILHKTDANNLLHGVLTSTSLTLTHVVGGVAHTLATTSSFTLINEGWYWLVLRQFPAPPGTPPQVQALVTPDLDYVANLAAVIAQITAATTDAVTALSGRPHLIVSGASLILGGAIPLSDSWGHFVQLFGPGGWLFTESSGNTHANCSGAWEAASANTFPNGPVTSYAAGRIDLPPNGSVDAIWGAFFVGAFSTGWLSPIKTAGDVVAASAWARSSGLGGAATILLQLAEFDGSFNLLATTTLATLTGDQPTWTQLSGTRTTSGATVYVAVWLRVTDTAVAGTSANASVWFDNAQCYDQTKTGQTTMPYCETRFPLSPAQILLSGLAGDVPSPALVATGGFFNSIPAGTTLTLRVGQRALATAGWQALLYPVAGTASSGGASVDAGAWGGAQFSMSSASLQALATGQAANGAPDSAQQGAYHLLARGSSAETTGALTSALAAANAYAALVYPWATSAQLLSAYLGPSYQTAMTTQNVEAVIDAGQLLIPITAAGALSAAAAIYEEVQVAITAPNNGVTYQFDWLGLLPVDGGYLAAQVIFPSNMSLSVSNEWLWAYFDGLAVQQGGAPAARYSLEPVGVPAPGNGVGGPGTLTSGYPSVNSAADPYLNVDPRQRLAGVGVNQFLAMLHDQNGVSEQMATEWQYSPLYLYPL